MTLTLSSNAFRCSQGSFPRPIRTPHVMTNRSASTGSLTCESGPAQRVRRLLQEALAEHGHSARSRLEGVPQEDLDALVQRFAQNQISVPPELLQFLAVGGEHSFFLQTPCEFMYDCKDYERQREDLDGWITTWPAEPADLAEIADFDEADGFASLKDNVIVFASETTLSIWYCMVAGHAGDPEAPDEARPVFMVDAETDPPCVAKYDDLAAFLGEKLGTYTSHFGRQSPE